MDDSRAGASGAAAEPAAVTSDQDSTAKARKTSPVPGSSTSALPQEHSAELAKATPSDYSHTEPQGTAPLATPGLSAAIATHAISPNKRRNSEAQREEGSASDSVVTGSPKRARAEAAPPKVLPQKYEFCRVEDIVVLIANMISELIETNDALALKSGHLTRFHSR
jgi:hypothetical protein